MYKFSSPTDPCLTKFDFDNVFIIVHVKHKYVKMSFCGMMIYAGSNVYWKVMHVDHINKNALNDVKEIDIMEIHNCFNYVELEKAISYTYALFEKSCDVTFYISETMQELYQNLNEIKNNSWKVSQ